ncbi:MAG TPA: hypothetical protein VGF94_12690 [Kofleriaceae bacterium]|jgi:hypothetical protein
MRLVSAAFLALIGGCSVGYQARVIPPQPPVVAVSADVGPAPAPVAAVDVEPEPAPVEYVQPDLVEVSPGVEVVYNYDYPVFFVNGFYWHQEGGVWYSSHYHTGGWARAGAPPREVVSIRNPGGYSHYHPAGFTPHRAPEPVRVRPGGGGRVEPVRPGGEVRPEPGRVEPRPEPGRVEPRPEPGRGEPVRPEPRPEPGRVEPVRPVGEPVRPEPRPEPHPVSVPVSHEPVRPAPVRPAPVRPAPPHPVPTPVRPTKHK